MDGMTANDVKIFEKKHRKQKHPALKLGKDELIAAIQQGKGLTYDVCLILGCTPIQLYSRLDKLGIRDEMTKARQGLVDKAESVLGTLLESDNDRVKLETAKFIAERLGREAGWSSRPDFAVQVNADNVDIKQIFGM